MSDVLKHLQEHPKTAFTYEEIANHFGISKTKAYYTLRKLYSEGEVKKAIIGKTHYYSIGEPAETEPWSWLDEIIYKIRRWLRSIR